MLVPGRGEAAAAARGGYADLAPAAAGEGRPAPDPAGRGAGEAATGGEDTAAVARRE